MRKQAKIAKYEYRKKRKRFINILFLIIIAMTVLCIAIFKFGFFNVKDVVVEGNTISRETEIIKASGLKIGDNYYSISPSNRAADISKIPIIKSVKIRLKLNRTAVITVEERIPKYQIENFLEYYILDDSLRVIDIQNSKLDVPIIDDANTELNLGEYAYKEENLLQFFEELSNQPIYSNINSINISDSDNLIMTKDGIQINIGTLVNLDYKFKMLEEILKDIYATGKNAKRIDMDKENPVVVIDELPNDET